MAVGCQRARRKNENDLMVMCRACSGLWALTARRMAEGRMRIAVLLVGVLVVVSVSRVASGQEPAAPQDSPPSRITQTNVDRQLKMAIPACVTAPGDGFFMHRPRTLLSHVTAKGLRGYVGPTFRVVGGLLPTTNLAAQAGAI